MLESNDVALKMLDDDCNVHLQERQFEPKRSEMYIEFSNLWYTVREHKGTMKTLLHNVTGHCEPGKITAIIGPSGAGKTTLLKILSGQRLANVTGAVKINGVEWDKKMMRKKLCYVPQQFEFLPYLTAKEILYVATRLKLDDNQSKRMIHLTVNDIAKSLGLSNCLDTLASKLSGGERKRLSISVEMITKPSILLLDEPTSGLDSIAANQLIILLHNMARENCTVVCAIHQSNNKMVSLFDNIMVLSQGRCMYCGPKSEILNTYSTAGFTCPNFYNIAEFVIEVVTGQRDGDLEKLYEVCRNKYEKLKLYKKQNENEIINSDEKLEMHRECSLTDNITSEKSTWQQQKILFWRAFICIKRDNILTKLRLFAHIINGVLLGILFYNFGNDAEKVLSNLACLFFYIMFLFYGNAMPAVQTFPTEATVFLQEHLNNWYSLRSYYSVKVLMDLPMQILCTSFFIFITYYMSGQPMDYDKILKVWIICLIVTIIGQTIGMLTGAAFGTETGYFLIPAGTIPLLLFAGFFLKIKEMAYLEFLSFVSFFRYAFEGILQTIYSNRTNLSCLEIYCALQSPDKILSFMNMPTMSFFVILIVLGTWIFCLHVIIYLILYWKIRYSTK